MSGEQVVPDLWELGLGLHLYAPHTLDLSPAEPESLILLTCYCLHPVIGPKRDRRFEAVCVGCSVLLRERCSDLRTQSKAGGISRGERNQASA